MPRVSIEQILSCPNLPSLPTVAMEVLALISDDNTTLAKIARIVQCDQALCAKILKTVNSSFFGLSKPCPTVTRALGYLGLSTVKSLVLGFSLVDCTRKRDAGLDLIDYWRRGVYAAAAARRIANACRAVDPEEASIAALMQDIGMLAIQASLGSVYQDMIAEAQGDHDRLPAIERSHLEFCHAEVGARLGERWRLPAEMIEAVRYHHDMQSIAEPHELTRVVELACQAAVALIGGRNAGMARFCRCAASWLRFDKAATSVLLAQIAQDAREMSRLLQINTGQAPDINATMARAEEAFVQHQLAVKRETDALRATNSNLAHQATSDALTGLANRRMLDGQLAERFSQARAYRGCLALLMVDVDKFNLLNDAHGHQAGDAVLVELARRMQSQVSDAGLACRYGGDEFAIILPGADRSAAAQMAEAVRCAIVAKPVMLQGLQGSAPSVKVTVSLGVAVLEPALAQCIPNPQTLIQLADKALYAAKGAGRNCVRVFTAKTPASVA